MHSIYAPKDHTIGQLKQRISAYLKKDESAIRLWRYETSCWRSSQQ